MLLNKCTGILRHFEEQKGILRLFVQLSAKEQMQVLLLEDSTCMQNYINAPITLGFKESQVVLGTKLEGVHNAYCAEILAIKQDSLFAKVTLKTQNMESQFPPINALCPLHCTTQNALKVGDCIHWSVLESAIMLFALD